MALLIRQVGRQCLRTKVFPVLCTRHIAPMGTTAKEEMQKFWNKNNELSRPLSPHLTIYKWSLPMAMSICHRGAGVVMTTGVSLFALSALFVPGDFASHVELIKSLSLPPQLIFCTKFAICVPLTYHMWNGLRHLVWDAGQGLKMPQVHWSCYFVLFMAVCAAFGMASA
ncbi:succinate dehydrogenase cytochrome b560 subunit, mitochondrial isoform X2 [Protopterus annectens]|uniref:succinate dehydrogenase cytochrome b560 subunit, mitochondrial isoform X2 n=1 Tax=Protopterus annectens TaxID=7888 RepID=UPI001CF946FC|nr:succinate dehydrogenase cytochrome b560 subunit, mitochondrial isoform X2 [Protopterus annectens]